MTTVQLFGDIGLYANYKQTVDFTSVSEQNTWFNSKAHTTINDVIYNKAYNSLKLNMQYGEAIKYSYIRLLNLDTSGRIYYYFVAGVNVIDDATVEFILEPDVLQTYMTFWNLKESMVNRGHVDRWNSSSTKPIRVTPNVEGIDAIYNMESNQVLCNTYTNVPSGNDETTYAIMFAYMVVKSSTGIEMYWSPFMVYPNNKYKPLQAQWISAEDGGSHYIGVASFASNNILTELSIDPESVLCMFVSPFAPYTYTKVASTSYPDNEYVLTFDGNSEKVTVGESSCIMKVTMVGLYTNKFYPNNFNIDAILPTKPTENATASDTFEPALYMAPYRSRVVMTPTASLYYEVPDSALLEDEIVSFVQAYGTTNQTAMLIYGKEFDLMYDNGVDTAIEASSEGMSQSFIMDSMDVFNNAWLTYALTQKDSDRQILNNNAISSVLQGLLFGSYGGALVTSRGTGGRDKRSLTKMATRMAPGIALGGLASAGAAIIDSHFAWENQLLEERKIQNKAQNIAINGTNGMQNAILGIGFPAFTVMKCDDTNYQRAYDNFRKYGYMINEFTQLNIRSRKYYNYVMTNGAVIGGSIPEDVRMTIADIFDSGVTIFHGDYCDELTYPTTENIERSLM